MYKPVFCWSNYVRQFRHCSPRIHHKLVENLNTLNQNRKKIHHIGSFCRSWLLEYLIIQYILYVEAKTASLGFRTYVHNNP